MRKSPICQRTLGTALLAAAAAFGPVFATGLPATPTLRPGQAQPGYEFISSNGAGFVASNPNHGFRARISPETGIALAPEGTGSPVWTWSLVPTRVGADGRLLPLAPGKIALDGTRLVWDQGAVRAQLTNGPAGLSQLLVLPAPDGDAPSVLELRLEGGLTPQLRQDGASIDFHTADGMGVLRYGPVTAMDANGRDVAVTIEQSNDTTFRLVVDGQRAAYPVDVEIGIIAPKRSSGQPRMLLSGASDIALDGNRLKPKQVLVAPPNDACGGAEIIPPAGPFPYLTTTVDQMDALISNDPSPTCAFNNVFSRGVWYRFTPATTAPYVLSTCTNSAPGTTNPDTVLAVFTSSDGTCGGVMTQFGCNDDDAACGFSDLQSTLPVTLNAGTNYFILAYSWDVTPPPASNVQLRVVQIVAPANDTCSSVPALTLDVPTTGTNQLAANDYQLSSVAPTCYTLPTPPAPIGQTASTAPGRDSVYSFTAPAADSYSFRVQNVVAAGGNPALYVASTCPAATPPTPVTVSGCLGASNRNINTGAFTGAEEVMCLPLTSGQQVFVYTDEVTATTLGGPYTIEVNRCGRETEPNGTTATAIAPTCGIEGSISPAADIDFYTLGTPPVGSRVFAMADGVSGNSTDFEMRVTTATDTLEYDDQDLTGVFGGLSPICGGTRLTGVPSFMRLSHFSAATQAEPYRLYSLVRPPGGGAGGSSATNEVEPNESTANASGPDNLFFYGTLPGPPPSTDFDAFRFCANRGDVIFGAIDGDPLRDGSPINPQIFLFDDVGNQLLGLSDANAASSTTSGAGSLTALTPNSPAEGITWRARYGGVYFLGVNTAATTAAGAGDYFVSIAPNCALTGTPSADLSVTKTDNVDPVVAGQNLVYTITVTNAGPNPAPEATLTDFLPANTTVVSLFGPGGWSCSLMGVTLECNTECMPIGSQVFTLTVQVNQCAGDGTVLTNDIDIFNIPNPSSDPNLSNNFTSESTTVSDPGTCDDGDACTINDVCTGSACGGTPTAPGEVTNVTHQADRETLTWDPASGAGAVHDVARGDALPVGSGLETCIAPGITPATTSDTDVPPDGQFYWYLVRGKNTCGTGTYGSATGGGPRISSACP